MSQVDEVAEKILQWNEYTTQKEICELIGTNSSTLWKLKTKKLPETSSVVQRIHLRVFELEDEYGGNPFAPEDDPALMPPEPEAGIETLPRALTPNDLLGQAIHELTEEFKQGRKISAISIAFQAHRARQEQVTLEIYVQLLRQLDLPEPLFTVLARWNMEGLDNE